MDKGFSKAIYYYLRCQDLNKNDVVSFDFFLNLMKSYRNMFGIRMKDKIFSQSNSLIIICHNFNRFNDLDMKLGEQAGKLNSFLSCKSLHDILGFSSRGCNVELFLRGLENRSSIEYINETGD